MRRKRIWYWIDAPDGLWWVKGLAKPVPSDHPAAREKGYANKRTARNARQALRIARAVPGCEFARFMTVRGKHYELRRWLTSAK
jgi:hypothetical protein